MKKLSSFCLFALLIGAVYSQEGPPRRLQAGMTGNFGINMVKSGDDYFKPNGFNHDLSIGMIFNTSFKNASNLGLSTGFEFDFTKLGYNTQDSVIYRYAGSTILQKDELGGTKYLLTNREYNTVGIGIPLMMLFRMQPIGDWKIFAKFGIRNSFMISQRISDRGYDITDIPTGGMTYSAKENANLKSFGDNFFYKGSVGFSAGAEWNFAGTTSLVPELGFYYGLTPLHYRAIEDNYTLSNTSGTYFYQKARQNQLILKVSLLF